MAGRVKDQRANNKHRTGTATVPPKERPNPGRQLIKGKRLDQVIVGANVEAPDPVLEGVACCKHQDPRHDALSRINPQCPAHL